MHLTNDQRETLNFLKRRMAWYAYGTSEYDTCQKALVKFCMDLRGESAKPLKEELMTFPKRGVPNVVKRHRTLVNLLNK